ncbi:DUF2189 domain-containing protein [Chelatococcus asaccharovorans]|uniref:Putative membrane protein n=1 Tax=Chelatococcus asaccharovorans TaxID=28210 RepID=A0A2V3U3J8_9HYPH|nr:DUF2189 domain-containing protein [Chelatococcus asaccharovorans]MBS7702955.1 DUF2189 domain-containing protein [Chelatococcus asaccharovorans]PXW57253.1 putative membrane protein [Chelatococcus asaccharovorans]CAH1674217.1 putative membrane protein [Chelatococcus asaccharovorans]CAH1674399.1 putative membrane protein [Chelatococcus asaccharovorans]
MTIRNPVEWMWDQLNQTAQVAGGFGHAIYHQGDAVRARRLPVNRIGFNDLREALRRGWQDFISYRSDVLFVMLIYPIAGLVLSQLAVGRSMLHLVFPLASGFALLGPFAATGLYEVSRRRELGQRGGWFEAFKVFSSPAFGSVAMLGLAMTLLFLLWLLAAMVVYHFTLGPAYPSSMGQFIADVFGTPAGWALILIGGGVGFLFALVVLAAGSISFPLLIDRHVGIVAAVATSVRAFTTNPIPMLTWGAIVAGTLILGSLPLLVGLIVVMPVLGHATWHLYRRLTAP